MENKKKRLNFSRMIFGIYSIVISFICLLRFFYVRRSRKTNRNLVVLMKIAAVHKAQKHAFQNFRLIVVVFNKLMSVASDLFNVKKNTNNCTSIVVYIKFQELFDRSLGKFTSTDTFIISMQLHIIRHEYS